MSTGVVVTRVMCRRNSEKDFLRVRDPMYSVLKKVASMRSTLMTHLLIKIRVEWFLKKCHYGSGIGEGKLSFVERDERLVD